jgi:hypothetical protein
VIVAVAGIVAALGLALATSAPEPIPSPAGIRLEADRGWVRAGGMIRIRVRSTPEAREDAHYGIPSVLERRSSHRWVPTHHLGFGLGWGGSKPSYMRYGDPRWAWRSIGFSGESWRPLRIPPDAQPGLHRIVVEVGVPGRPIAASLVVCRECRAIALAAPAVG